MEEKRTALGRTPTDKAWQELKRHRQQMQEDSTRIIDEIGRLEREVRALQARLEEEQVGRAAQHQATAVAVQPSIKHVRTDDPVDQPAPPEEINIATSSTSRDDSLQLDPKFDESAAFDTFFAVDDSELDKERRFLLD